MTNAETDMSMIQISHEEITKAIAGLPTEVLPELADYIEQLRAQKSLNDASGKKQNNSFLTNITGIGASEEYDISGRDEDILANECDPVHGWTLKTADK